MYRHHGGGPAQWCAWMGTCTEGTCAQSNYAGQSRDGWQHLPQSCTNMSRQYTGNAKSGILVPSWSYVSAHSNHRRDAATRRSAHHPRRRAKPLRACVGTAPPTVCSAELRTALKTQSTASRIAARLGQRYCNAANGSSNKTHCSCPGSAARKHTSALVLAASRLLTLRQCHAPRRHAASQLCVQCSSLTANPPPYGVVGATPSPGPNMRDPH